MKTYTFNVVVEPDDDRWYAEGPLLVRQGAATWGYTREEALIHIEEVVKMVVESLIEHGAPVPEGHSDQVQVSVTPRVGCCHRLMGINYAHLHNQPGKS